MYRCKADSLLVHYIVGGVFSLEHKRYLTTESDDSVEVCVVHDSGDLEEDIALTVCTSRGNAISNET